METATLVDKQDISNSSQVCSALSEACIPEQCWSTEPVVLPCQKHVDCSPTINSSLNPVYEGT